MRVFVTNRSKDEDGQPRQKTYDETIWEDNLADKLAEIGKGHAARMAEKPNPLERTAQAPMAEEEMEAVPVEPEVAVEPEQPDSVAADAELLVAATDELQKWLRPLTEGLVLEEGKRERLSAMDLDRFLRALADVVRDESRWWRQGAWAGRSDIKLQAIRDTINVLLQMAPDQIRTNVEIRPQLQALEQKMNQSIQTDNAQTVAGLIVDIAETYVPPTAATEPQVQGF